MPQIAKVTDTDEVLLYETAAKMKAAGLPDSFIAAAVRFRSLQPCS